MTRLGMKATIKTQWIMMRNKSFCAFILSHGRADNIKTIKALHKCGYTGDIRFLCDDEDEQLPRYKDNFGEGNVAVFNKDEASKLFDPMDNFGVRKVITFARNQCFLEAKRLGYKNFIELDDDFSDFIFKYDKERRFVSRIAIPNLDDVFDILVDFLNSTPTTTIALSQGGDFIGGYKGMFGQKIFLRRKAMNSFIFKTESAPIFFQGTLNEDVTTYVRFGNTGNLFFTNNIVCLNQELSQQGKSGITDIYKNLGTYVKSFYTIMAAPSCVRINAMGQVDMRIHHSIKWKYAVPKIISEKHKRQI